ncbi:unnamed protein product, partial [Ilex paraguariensis]
MKEPLRDMRKSAKPAEEKETKGPLVSFSSAGFADFLMVSQWFFHLLDAGYWSAAMVSLLLLPSAVSWGFVLSGLSVAVLVLGLCSFLMVFIISQLLSLGFPAFPQLNFLDLQLDSQLAFAG